MALFERGPLEQDTGRINERWAQDGSNIVNDCSVSDLGWNTQHTVTTGKRFFIKDVYVNNDDATAMIYFHDGTPSSSNRKLACFLAASEKIMFNFEVPIFFDDSVVICVNGAGSSANVTFTGWEESL